MYDHDDLPREGLLRLLYLLEQTCDTPDHVAELLVKGHYLGFAGAGCSCPVAAYLSAGVGVPVLVDGWMVNILGDGYEYVYVLPYAVRDFIRNFDCGQYPDLQRAPLDTQGDTHDRRTAGQGIAYAPAEL